MRKWAQRSTMVTPQLFPECSDSHFRGNCLATYHGWVVTRTGLAPGKGGPAEFEAYNRTEDALFKHLRDEVERLDESERNCFFFNDGFNGMYSMMLAGQFNHRRDAILDIFRWLAEHGPGSYGLLFVRDDEDPRGIEFYEWRVWRLARGKLREFEDLYLSPEIPTTEGSWNPFTWLGKPVPGNCRSCEGSGTCVGCLGRRQRSIECATCVGNGKCIDCNGTGMIGALPR